MTGNTEGSNAVRYQEGKPGSHQLNDPSQFVMLLPHGIMALTSEQRIKGQSPTVWLLKRFVFQYTKQLRRLTVHQRQGEPQDDAETAALKKDPTLPARMHGNQPSRGAEIDAQIAAEEEEELKRKGKA
ncbi:hypothetical protein E4U42_003401 [Claviceps africana]|uniref:Uncharacterized protein n=1 Tax=Claviceps africana TaxID=83212 RepID=A0A8K0J745_9HYPO|nr:hypothetical protein E4U42_003401 [Claviceps africana]